MTHTSDASNAEDSYLDEHIATNHRSPSRTKGIQHEVEPEAGTSDQDPRHTEVSDTETSELEDGFAELRLHTSKDKRSQDANPFSSISSVDGTYDNQTKLSLAQQKLQEAEARLELAKQKEEELERREEIIRRKTGLKYIRDLQESENEEARIERREKRFRVDWQLKRERKERARDLKARDK